MVMGRRIRSEKIWLSLTSTIWFFCLGFLGLNQKLIFAQGSDNVCPLPILSRLQRHKIQAGETIASIAEKYALIPATIIKLNPTILKNGLAPVGKEIFIPPMNGIRIEAPKGST